MYGSTATSSRPYSRAPSPHYAAAQNGLNRSGATSTNRPSTPVKGATYVATSISQYPARTSSARPMTRAPTPPGFLRSSTTVPGLGRHPSATSTSGHPPSRSYGSSSSQQLGNTSSATLSLSNTRPLSATGYYPPVSGLNRSNSRVSVKLSPSLSSSVPRPAMPHPYTSTATAGLPSTRSRGIPSGGAPPPSWNPPPQKPSAPRAPASREDSQRCANRVFTTLNLTDKSSVALRADLASLYQKLETLLTHCASSLVLFLRKLPRNTSAARLAVTYLQRFEDVLVRLTANRTAQLYEVASNFVKLAQIYQQPGVGREAVVENTQALSCHIAALEVGWRSQLEQFGILWTNWYMTDYQILLTAVRACVGPQEYGNVEAEGRNATKTMAACYHALKTFYRPIVVLLDYGIAFTIGDNFHPERSPGQYFAAQDAARVQSIFTQLVPRVYQTNQNLLRVAHAVRNCRKTLEGQTPSVAVGMVATPVGGRPASRVGSRPPSPSISSIRSSSRQTYR